MKERRESPTRRHNIKLKTEAIVNGSNNIRFRFKLLFSKFTNIQKAKSPQLIIYN